MGGITFQSDQDKQLFFLDAKDQVFPEEVWAQGTDVPSLGLDCGGLTRGL